jgi:hypothetical protein
MFCKLTNTVGLEAKRTALSPIPLGKLYAKSCYSGIYQLHNFCMFSTCESLIFEIGGGEVRRNCNS